jgi:hypothetical protein
MDNIVIIRIMVMEAKSFPLMISMGVSKVVNKAPYVDLSRSSVMLPAVKAGIIRFRSSKFTEKKMEKIFLALSVTTDCTPPDGHKSSSSEARHPRYSPMRKRLFQERETVVNSRLKIGLDNRIIFPIPFRRRR